MTEREAAVEWLEGLTRSQHREHFLPAAVVMIGYEDDSIGTLASLKDDHEGTVEYCRWCKDPGLVVVG